MVLHNASPIRIYVWFIRNRNNKINSLCHLGVNISSSSPHLRLLEIVISIIVLPASNFDYKFDI